MPQKLKIAIKPTFVAPVVMRVRLPVLRQLLRLPAVGGFAEGMRRIFPDREIVDLPDDHPLFHTVCNLDAKHMVPHFEEWSGGAGWLSGGDTPHWRGVLDDDGRVMVAIAFNNDVSDSFQWADDPRYPAESASLGLRIGVNFAVYSLTH